MKVSLKTEIKDYNGSPIQKSEKETLTLADILITSLQTPLKGDENDLGEERSKKFQLIMTVYNSRKGDVEIDSDDIKLLKDRVRKIYPSPIIYGRFLEIIGDKS